MMRLKALFAALMLFSTWGWAQNDPAIMTINGQPVSRSEFEYSYNKNNADGVIDKKSVDEYVDLFVNYKLKVQAALDAKLDTLKSFKQEFLTYRNQQIRPAMIDDSDVEAEAQKIYRETKLRIDSNGGLFRCAHILLSLNQRAGSAEQETIKNRADSVYNAIMKGASFSEMARKYSGDKASAVNGGNLPLLSKGQTVAEFENALLQLKPGEVSRPVLSPFGYHIIKFIGKESLQPYDSLKADIHQFIEVRNLREQIIDQKLQELSSKAGEGITPEQLLDQKLAEMEAKDPDLKNLVREYHDGLLLFEISNRTVWAKAAKDEAGLQAFFKKNKKNYKWDKPRFKGIAYHVKDKADVNALKKSVKGLPFDQWADKLRTTFNNDSIIRIRVEKGIFKEGDNSLVDREVFKKNVEVKPTKDYPIDAVFGTKLKAPKEMSDVRGLVTSDYQEALEKEWVAELRKKYNVVINRDVVATVNKH